ncbi:MAG: hypothetical protein ACRDM7_23645, partial [Thermoleophilaceae bacterium]
LLTPRQTAKAAGEKRYHGRPCKNCGGTEQLVSNWYCVACDRARKRVENMTPEQIEKECERARERYWNMSGYEYNRMLLRARRSNGLARVAERNEQRRPIPAATQEAQRGWERIKAKHRQRLSGPSDSPQSLRALAHAVVSDAISDANPRGRQS